MRLRADGPPYPCRGTSNVADPPGFEKGVHWHQAVFPPLAKANRGLVAQSPAASNYWLCSIRSFDSSMMMIIIIVVVLRILCFLEAFHEGLDFILNLIASVTCHPILAMTIGSLQ